MFRLKSFLCISVLSMFTSVAMANSILLKNATSCHVTDDGFKKGKEVALYSYTVSESGDHSTIKEFASITPEGPAPIVTLDGTTGVIIGEANKNHLTVNGYTPDVGYVVTDEAAKDGCSDTCYVTWYISNPCESNEKQSIRKYPIIKLH